MAIRQGTIGWAYIAPAHGQPKRRPVIVYTPDDIIRRSNFLDVACISHSYRYGEPLAIPLPWQTEGNIHTRLKMDCAICLNFLDRIPKDSFTETGFLRATDGAFIELLKTLKSLGKL